MIGKNLHYSISLRLAALALATLCLTQLNLRAQALQSQGAAAAASDDHHPTETVTFVYGKLSLGYGQTLRLNLTNAVDTAQASQPASAIRAIAQFKDAAGRVIAASPGVGFLRSIDGGKSWSFEVNRDQLQLAGDPRTGAVALVPELVVEVPTGAGEDLPVSLEIADNLTGKLVFHQGRSVTRRPSTAATKNVYTITFQGSLCGVTHGETLQVNLTNPLPLALANQHIAGAEYNLKIKNTDGIVLGTRNGAVRAGQTIVAGFNRDQLPAAGEPGTGRLPLAVEITYRLLLTPAQFAALGQAPQFPVSLEFVDNSTGKTGVYDPGRATFYLRNSNTP